MDLDEGVNGLYGQVRATVDQDVDVLIKLKSDVDRNGGCRQWIDEVACERLSSQLTELFDRHCLRLVQMMAEVESTSETGVSEDWSAYASLTSQLAEFAAETCSQFDRALRVSHAKHYIMLRYITVCYATLR